MDWWGWIFPRKCVGCQKSSRYFCDQCRQKVTYESLICPVCKKQQPFGETHKICQNRHNLDGAVTVFAYEGLIREGLHELKYRFVSDLVSELASWWLAEMEGEHFLVFHRFVVEKQPVVVAVPLAKRRENWRGFNQAVMLAKHLADKYGLPVSKNTLKRIGHNRPQVELKRSERVENVRGIFTFTGDTTVVPEAVLLVDDVWTTGATVSEAARVLKENGVKEVWAVTVAR